MDESRHPLETRLIPDQMTVLTTSGCTARCAHCLVRSGPERSDTLGYDEIARALECAHSAGRLSVVVFAGGEPTMLGEDLLDAIAHVNGLGIGTRIVTNASWATDPESARAMVTKLREAGLDEINVSADDFHLPFIPLENVVHAWWACKATGFSSVVIALSSGPGSKLRPKQMMEALGEEVPVTYDDDGGCLPKPAPSADGTTYLIANNSVYRIGRGRKLRETYVSFPRSPKRLDRPCPWAIRSAAISPKNHLVACCGIEAEHNEVLDFGSLDEASVDELVDRANDDPVVVGIAELGPHHMMERAKQLDPSLRFRRRYSAICEICEDVTTNRQAVAALRSDPGGLKGEIAAVRFLRAVKAEGRDSEASSGELTLAAASPSELDDRRHGRMTAPLGEVRAPARIDAVPEALARCGFTELAASFPPWTDTTASRGHAVAALDDPLRAAGELLMLGRAVPIDRLPMPLVDVIPALEGAGLCTIDDGCAHLHGLALFYLQGALFFAHIPQISPTLYFGPDSAALAARLDTRPGRCLDLCAGPGVQSLVCSGRGMDVAAVELNPVAAALCSVNVALNGRSSQVSVRCGDLYEAVQGERFDLVCANPPLLPVPAGLPYPFVGDGGPDGMDVTWRILDGLGRHLTASGHAQLIGMTLSDGFLPLAMADLRRWCADSGFQLVFTTISHFPTTIDSAWVRGVAATSSAHAGRMAPDEIESARQALSQGYAALGASHVCTYFMRIARGDGAVTYLDVSEPRGQEQLWYR
jgi:release factor glutamine methyltransferase